MSAADSRVAPTPHKPPGICRMGVLTAELQVAHFPLTRFPGCSQRSGSRACRQQKQLQISHDRCPCLQGHKGQQLFIPTARTCDAQSASISKCRHALCCPASLSIESPQPSRAGVTPLSRKGNGAYRPTGWSQTRESDPPNGPKPSAPRPKCTCKQAPKTCYVRHSVQDAPTSRHPPTCNLSYQAHPQTHSSCLPSSQCTNRRPDTPKQNQSRPCATTWGGMGD